VKYYSANEKEVKKEYKTIREALEESQKIASSRVLNQVIPKGTNGRSKDGKGGKEGRS
jgi:hypothetical protein